jgi:transglutaminase-like putative cysteine protease
MRAIAYVTLSIFFIVNESPSEQAMAGAVRALGAPAMRLDRSAGSHALAIDDLKSQLDALSTVQTPNALNRHKAALRDLRAALQGENAKALAEFAVVAEHIKSHGLPDSILRRHEETVAKFRDQATQLDADLADIDQAVETGQASAKAKRLKERLSVLQLARSHQAFKPQVLPFSATKGVQRPARTTTKQYIGFSSESHRGRPLLASLNPMLQLSSALITPDELAATEDVQITPAITQLAAQLKNNPVAIYNWVHNNIEYVPTYGSIQGSDLTFRTRRGNSFDTSSLLIALLRSANVPARYVYGTVDIPSDAVMNWVGGVTTPTAATDLLGQGGIPVQALAQGGVIKTVRMEHVWVEAYVDNTPSRGAVSVSPDAWVPMDASFKKYQYTGGVDIVNNPPTLGSPALTNALNSLVVNSAQGSVGGFTVAATRAAVTQAQTQLKAYFNQVQSAGGWVIRERTIVSPNAPVLAATLPYHVVVRGSEFSVLPAGLRRSFEVRLYHSVSDQNNDSGALVFHMDLPALADRSVSLQFVPATAADQAVIASYLPTAMGGTSTSATTLPTALPGYLVNLTAIFTVDGVEVSRDTNYTLGQDIATTVSIQRLAGDWHTTESVNTAGEYLAFCLDLQGNGSTALLKSGSQTTENLLHQAGRGYWGNLDEHLTMLAGAGFAVGVRQPSFGIFSTRFSPVFRFGIPWEARLDGVSVDVGGALQSLVAYDDDPQRAVRAIELIGLFASDMEHEIPQFYLSPVGNTVKGVSAVSLMATAISAGQPLYLITGANAGTVVPLLAQSADVVADIQSAVAAGQEVMVPNGPVTMGDWTGAGYIIEDPATGSAAYRINGGLNGGADHTDMGDAMAAFGLGMLAVPIPVPASDTGDCGQQKQHQFDWQTALTAAMILILIAALVVIIGTLAPPVIVGLSELILTVVIPFFAVQANAATGQCAAYLVGSFAGSTGNSMLQQQAHVASALGLANPVTYRGPDAIVDRSWYNSTPECNSIARDAYESANGMAGQCDEYPFGKTFEGGAINYAAGKVSIKLINASDNLVGGGTLRQFLGQCGVFSFEQFKVTIVPGASGGRDRNGNVCY